jgi:hypothetical protein
MASSSTCTLPEEEELWGRLPEELVLRVLDREWTRGDVSGVEGYPRR